MKTKPSDFLVFPFSSVLQHTEDEVVASNIMKILKRTGNTFRDITCEEYKKERLKDTTAPEGRLCDFEKETFGKVIDYCKSADTAKLFSKEWKD